MKGGGAVKAPSPDELEQVSLEQAWDQFREACIPPEALADQVRDQRQTFMAGAVLVLYLESQLRGLGKSRGRAVLDRLLREGHATAAAIAAQDVCMGTRQ